MTRRAALRAVTTALACFAAVSRSAAQNPQPVAEARRVTTPPVIDGRLDDQAWREAVPTADFRQRDPREGEPATEPTIVRIVFDESMLYIGAELRDSDPGAIRASELRRDNELSSDDTFAVLLDTFHDHRNAFLFRVNARGARFDAVVRNESHEPTAEWDEQWTAAARVSDTGWSVEIAIPFKVLRFRAEQEQTWGLNFERLIKRKNEETYWAGWDRNYNFTHVSQAGQLVGLAGIKQGGRIRIRPYAVAGVENLQAVPDPSGTDFDPNVGLDDVKISVTSDLTADLAVNPDFAQTEVDEQRVNLTRFSLFFPEKRQFFIEGADSFKMSAPQVGWESPPAELFYSRRIGLSDAGDPIPILAGGKLNGKVGGIELGVMDVQTDTSSGVAGENFAVVRGRQEVLGRSYFGAIFTNRQDGGEYNRVWGADGRFVLFDYLTLTGMLAGNTATGTEGTEWLRQLGASWDDDFLRAGVQYLDIDPEFDPGIGFVERNDRMVSAQLAVMPRPKRGVVRQFEFSPEATVHHDQSGLLLTRELMFGVETAFQTGDELDVGAGNTVEQLTEPFRIAPDVVLPPGRYEWNSVELRGSSFEGRKASVEAAVTLGGFYSGTKQSLEVSGNYRPGAHLSFNPSYEFNHVDLKEGAFNTNLFGLRANVSFTTNLLTAAYLQYNSAGELAAVQLRFNYIYRNIDNVYLVYNDTRYTGGPYEHRANRSLVFKVTYSIHR